jgi:hypothetical protein
MDGYIEWELPSVEMERKWRNNNGRNEPKALNEQGFSGRNCETDGAQGGL